MRKIFAALFLFAVLVPAPTNAQTLYAFAYHDVVRIENSDRYALTRSALRKHLNYFRRNGIQPISLAYLNKVVGGELRLPHRAVLLTFDDGLISYRDVVVPLLKEYGYPSVVSIVTGWLDGKQIPAEYSGKLLDWKAIRKLERSPLVEVVSHSHNLHQGIQSNPQGNVANAGVTRQYRSASASYETENQFTRRIRGDLSTSFRRFRKELRHAPIAITWPYGAYDRITAGIASTLGFTLQLTLDEGGVLLPDLPRIRRFLVSSNTDIDALAAIMLDTTRESPAVRFIDFDLQSLVGVSDIERELRLSRLLDSIKELRVNMVIIDGLTRDQRSTVFHGRVLASADDILNRVLHQIDTRLGIEQRFVRLPASLELRNRELFFRDLARLNAITGIIFEGPGTPHKLDKIKQIVRTYRPNARFGYIGKPKLNARYDFVINSLRVEDIAALQVRPKSSRRYVSLVVPDGVDASVLARAMYKLRQKGIINYGYQNLDLAQTKQTYPQIITELSVKSEPERATSAEVLFFFVFFYPLFMAIFWMMGAVTFFFRREWGRKNVPTLDVYPRVSILVPCHNEELCLRDTIEHLAKNNYPKFEIIAINDGSTDKTNIILEELSSRIEILRVITLSQNYGKAKALRAGATASQGEFLMCIDADALLDKNALFWMMAHFLSGPRVGAVTGNPRVINRNGLLSRIQIGEFSAIVGMIKRTQRSIGRLFTVSGVNTCYRRSAVHSVGYWSSDTVTEDVDMSWRLQLAHWDIRYEPQALTWILVPESLNGLWKQRLRWAKGGFEAATRFASRMRAWHSRRMWSVFIEYWLGVIWCFALASTFVFWAATQILPTAWWPDSLVIKSLLPGWTGVILAVTCLVQFAVGLGLDSYYEKRGLMRNLFWAIWYPALYWMISATTTVVAILTGLKNIRKSRTGLWNSPGRAGKPYPEIRRLPQRQMEGERRRYFQNRSIINSPQKATEVLMTVLFWGLWSYLITPLVSLVLWSAGIYLFTDRMISMGGYQAFSEQLVSYAMFIAAMGGVLALWVIWNQQRYGRRDKRNVIPDHVSQEQVVEVTGLDQGIVDALRQAKKITMHFRDGLPVIEKKAP